MSACTIGPHSTVAEAAVAEKTSTTVDANAVKADRAPLAPATATAAAVGASKTPPARAAPPPQASPAPTPSAELDSDDPAVPIPAHATCRRRGCGAAYATSGATPDEPCRHHPGPPIFHEGRKGYTCCSRRELDFDDFLTIKGCTARPKHLFVGSGRKTSTTVDASAVKADQASLAPAAAIATAATATAAAVGASKTPPARALPPPQASPAPAPSAESDSDDPAVPIPAHATCRRRGCRAAYATSSAKPDEPCRHHPGPPIFHEGRKGYTCCSRRELDFDDFLTIEGCKARPKHLFVGSGRSGGGTAAAAAAAAAVAPVGEQILETVRNDFYQTGTTVMLSFYLKKIDAGRAVVRFASPRRIDLDLPTADQKRYTATIPLYAAIDPDRSTFTIMATKLEMCLVKADGASWPSLRSDEPPTAGIIQVKQATHA
ncbi:MAG: hypothetical protein M1826_005984 [Phylliscum demangeonii]|nr:MAG: hypothetical protein M1826_005984 [Phylliscum demangeonii]